MYNSASESAIENYKIYQKLMSLSCPSIKFNVKHKTEEVQIQTTNTSGTTVKTRKARSKKTKHIFISKALQILNKSCRSTQYPSNQNITGSKRVAQLAPQRSKRTTRNMKKYNIGNVDENRETQDAKYYKIIKDNKELIVLRDREAKNDKVEYINDIHKTIAQGLQRNKQKYFMKQKPLIAPPEDEKKTVELEKENYPNKEEQNNLTQKNVSDSLGIKYKNVVRKNRNHIFSLKPLAHDLIITNPLPQYEEQKTLHNRTMTRRQARKAKRLEKERNIILDILTKDVDITVPPRNMYESLKLMASKRQKLLTILDIDGDNEIRSKEFMGKHYFM